MRPSTHELEQLVRGLGPGWEAAAATEPLPVPELTPGEVRALDALPRSAARRSCWLIGRRALRALAVRTGHDPDTAALVLPSPRVSLTHSGGVALAVAMDAPEPRGVGVDLEWRQPVAQASRFFLDEQEEDLLGQVGEAAGRTLQRLWTVKEAVYKADLANAGRQLRDYHVLDPRRSRGEARSGKARPRRFAYHSFAVADGFVTIAHRRPSHA